MEDRGAARRATEEVRWPQLAAGRYPTLPYVVLSAFLLVSSACAALLSLIPTEVEYPHAYVVTAALFYLAMALWVWFLGPRLRNGWGLDVAVVVTAVVTIASAAEAGSPEVQVLLGLSMMLFGVYAAYFRPQRRFVAELLLMLLTYGLVVVLASVLHPLYYVVVALLTAAVSGTVAVLVAELREQAVSDGLTGVLNRRGLRAMGTYVEAERQRTGGPVAVGLVDIDDFKAYNDHHGHIAGDALLVSVARTLTTGLRATDVVARFGGDEFALVMPGANAEQAVAALERLARTTTDATWSAGVADWKPPESLESALSRADERLYRLKHAR